MIGPTDVEIERSDRMEAAGCIAIEALKAVKANGALSDAQRNLVDEALDAMFNAKERWHSEPAAGRELENKKGNQ